jgi:hypothetical protein
MFPTNSVQKHLMFPYVSHKYFLVFSQSGKHGETLVGNNVSATMFPQECFLVCPGLNSRKCNMILSNSTARWSCKLLNLWEMMHIMWKFRNCTQVLALHMYSNRHFCAFKLYNEYFRLLTFLIISATCLDHFKSLLIVSPKTLA